MLAMPARGARAGRRARHAGREEAPHRQGAVVTPLGARDFGGLIRAEMTKWADVIHKANIKFE